MNTPGDHYGYRRFKSELPRSVAARSSRSRNEERGQLDLVEAKQCDSVHLAYNVVCAPCLRSNLRRGLSVP